MADEFTGLMINQLESRDDNKLRPTDVIAGQGTDGETYHGTIEQVVEQVVNNEYVSAFIGDKREIPGPFLNSELEGNDFEGSSVASPTDEAVKAFIARQFDTESGLFNPPKPGTIYYVAVTSPGIPGSDDSPQRIWLYTSGNAAENNIQVTRVSNRAASYDVTLDEDNVGVPMTPIVVADSTGAVVTLAEVEEYVNDNLPRIKNGDWLYYNYRGHHYLWLCVGAAKGNQGNVLEVRRPETPFPQLPQQARRIELPEESYAGAVPTDTEIADYLDSPQGQNVPVGAILYISGNSTNPIRPDYGWLVTNNTSGNERVFTEIRKPAAPSSGGGEVYRRYFNGELRYNATAETLTYDRNSDTVNIVIPAGTHVKNMAIKMPHDYSGASLNINITDENGDVNTDPDNDMQPLVQFIQRDNFNHDPPTNTDEWQYLQNQTLRPQSHVVGYGNGECNIKLVGVDNFEKYTVLIFWV